MTSYDLVCQPPSPQRLPVNRQLMGAWTSQPEIAQRLFVLGIPVWLTPYAVSNFTVGSRCTRARLVNTTCWRRSRPKHIGSSLLPTANIVDPDDYYAPSRADGQLLHSRASAFQSRERCGPSSQSRVKPKPKPKRARYNKLAQDRTSLAQPSQIRGRDKFIDVALTWMPPSQSSWESAMHAVDRFAIAKVVTDLWGYWIPEPALLLGPKDPIGQQLYLLNWVRTQRVCLYMLQVPESSAVKVSPQAWRNFLNDVPEEPTSVTKTGRRVFEDQDLRPMEGGADEGEVEVEWHRRRLTAKDFELNGQLGPCVVWETFELGICYELVALDRPLRPQAFPEDIVARESCLARVFPANSLWTVSHLPAEDSWSVFAPLPHRRVNALNALRDILRSWVRCPSSIRDAKPLQLSDSAESIEQLELDLTLFYTFYTQTFFDESGRAPIVPHRWPGLAAKP